MTEPNTDQTNVDTQNRHIAPAIIIIIIFILCIHFTTYTYIYTRTPEYVVYIALEPTYIYRYMLDPRAPRAELHAAITVHTALDETLSGAEACGLILTHLTLIESGSLCCILRRRGATPPPIYFVVLDYCWPFVWIIVGRSIEWRGARTAIIGWSGSPRNTLLQPGREKRPLLDVLQSSRAPCYST